MIDPAPTAVAPASPHRGGRPLSRRRIRPNWLSCSRCDGDFPEDDFREVHDGRPGRSEKPYRASRCRTCERISNIIDQDQRRREDPAFAERRRVVIMRCRRRKSARLREEREWATALLRRNVCTLIERGWSCRGIADALGCNKTSIRVWARGSRLVKGQTVARLHLKML